MLKNVALGLVYNIDKEDEQTLAECDGFYFCILRCELRDGILWVNGCGLGMCVQGKMKVTMVL